jgi:hypothetical protein
MCSTITVARMLPRGISNQSSENSNTSFQSFASRWFSSLGR